MRTKEEYRSHVTRYLRFKGYKHQAHDLAAFVHQAWDRRWGKLRINAEIEGAFGPRDIIPPGDESLD